MKEARQHTGLQKSVALLRTYCNQNETIHQVDGLVAEAHRQIKGTVPHRTPRARRSERTEKKLPAKTRRANVAKYKAGQTMKQIAARHHTHRVTVSEVLNRTGTTKRPKGMNPGQVDIVVRLYESGLSLASVGTQLKFDAATFRTMLLRRGVKTRDSRGRER